MGALTAEQKKVDVSACWAELAGADRLAAYVAFCRLRLTPDETIPFLKKELAKQAPAAELEKTRRAWAIRLLEDLNTPSAQAVLQSLAESTPEAEAAIKRLKRKDSQIRKS